MKSSHIRTWHKVDTPIVQVGPAERRVEAQIAEASGGAKGCFHGEPGRAILRKRANIWGGAS
jgi:hypothetical protein